MGKVLALCLADKGTMLAIVTIIIISIIIFIITIGSN